MPTSVDQYSPVAPDVRRKQVSPLYYLHPASPALVPGPIGFTVPEYYADLVQTVVATGGYTAGSGILNVQSTGLPFSQTNVMHVHIVDAATKLVKAILKLTALNSSTQWACVADTSHDGNGAAGDLVRLCLTQGAMDQIKLDIAGKVSQQDTYASLSAGPLATNGAFVGAKCEQTDGPYDWRWNGSIWVPRIPGQGIVTLPPTSGWTWDNQGGGTADSAYGYLHLDAPRAGAVNGRGYYRTAPATPYTLTVFMRMNLPSAGETGVTGSNMGGGIGFRDSSGKWINLYWVLAGNWEIDYAKWNSSTSINANYYNYSASGAADWIASRNGIWLRLKDDGTDLIPYWSLNGQYWKQVDPTLRSRTDFMTSGPNAIGMFLYTNGDGVQADVLHWVVD